jgi:hypothetical protein
MKKLLVISCLLLSTVKLLGQQYSQYSTGTLYDSFENPSQRSFIPDSSRSIASNFFIPSLSANFFVTGNGQDAILDRIFNGYYNTAALKIGEGKYSTLRSTTNNYWAMLKIFTSLNGNQEIGFSISSRAEARGHVTDESIALFNGAQKFNQLSYSDIFNDNYSYQVYHQFSFSFREQVTPRLALGVKLSALLGSAYSSVNINRSGIMFDPANDAAMISLSGTAQTSEKLKKFTFDNPGLAITIGTGYTNRGGYHFQYNLKDLGVIRWGGKSYTADFVNEGTLIEGISSAQRETNIIDAVGNITSGSKTSRVFYGKTNAIAEVSVNKNYWFDYDHRFKLSPTVIVSKELFYEGLLSAAVVPFSYKNYTVTATTSYHTLGLFNWGAQFMYKTPNAEFFIGSERLYQTARTVKTALRNTNNQPQVKRSTGSYSGADVFLGVSFKFGRDIEHPMNASFIPDGGERGFLGRMWDKIFNGKDKNY